MFQVNVNENFEYSEISGNIYGPFFVMCNACSFPAETWWDFPVSVLHMWSDNIISNLHKKKYTIKLFFMDGPYYIQIKKTIIDNVTIQCYDTHKKKRLICEEVITYKDFIEKIINAIKKTICFLATKHYSVPEKEMLINSLTLLEEYYQLVFN